MNIDFVTPVAPDRDLGAEYNRVMRSCQAPWVCIRDCDTMFLTRMDVVRRALEEYIEMSPTGLLTCLTNRIYNPAQRLPGMEDIYAVKPHIAKAKGLIAGKPALEPSPLRIGGFFMLVRKSLWEEVGGFDEGRGLIRVDGSFSDKCSEAGNPPMVMQTVYVFHVYRMLEGKGYREHLVCG